MKSTIKKLSSKFCTSVIAAVALSAVATTANSDVFLQAQSFDKQLANSVTVPMWGFASCTDATFTSCTLDANAPGPQIDAFAGSNLIIHVNNTLPTPVSIVIPGQVGSGSPTTMTDASGRQRVKSFTHEVAAGTNGSYNWSSLKSGTYLYQSGTHPSLQVPMGLYGALVVREDAAQVYTGISTDSESVLLFSEVDPVQNQRVVNAAVTNPNPTVQCVSLETYNQFQTLGYPCTVDYNPVYFLANGAAQADLSFVKAESTLLRLINAGLRSHTPSIVGLELGLIAEDGNLYPGLPRRQSAVLIAAGKTLDAVVAIPNTDVTLSLIDHMPTFDNENKTEDEALGSIQIGTGSPVFVPVASLAVDDAYNVIEDTNLIVSAAAGVLANDNGLSPASIINGPSNGSILLNTDGSFDYTPNENFSGADSFIYSADGNNAQVALSVSFVNDTPVANGDGPFVNTIGTDINVAAPGILANDSDVDGDPLTAVISGATPAGLTLNPDGSFTYTGTVDTTFSYVANDGSNDSAPVTVSITSNPVAGIALTVVDTLGVEITNYRWTVEENIMFYAEPGIINPQSLGNNFHKSHMPVVAQGTGALELSTLALDPTKHYYVSVLPADAAQDIGHTIGGAQIPPGATAVTVKVNITPLPTAQISIYVFEDNSPTNGIVDGNETGLGGFQIVIEEAGGRYGASGGQMNQDVFGELLKNSLDCFGATPPPPGVIVSCPDTQANRDSGLVGQALVKNLYQGKYGIITTSPFGDTRKWLQTSTIEGSKVIDAWVKAGEPPFFKEFGPAGPGAWHVFVGFVSPERLAAANPGGTNNVTGKITNMHLSRPPNQQLFDSGSYDSLAHTRAWVGINSVGGIGPNFAAVQAAEDGTFSIAGIPNGTYQLVVWDNYLDQIIGYRSLILPGGGDVGNVPIFQWFTRAEHNVFLDTNQNGIRDAGEVPVSEQGVTLRWRDGTVNQAFPTDLEGFVPFDEVFPFFHWQVMEVDFARFKATGLTTTVDGGGDVSATGGVLNPQVQADGATSRTELGPVLTQGFQGFLGQTSIFDWGKAPYAPGENGGVSGIVYYASTRAENNPRYAAGEEWEPGVPSATVRLYREVTRADATTALVLVSETQTDSWDNSLPEGCPGADPIDVQFVGGAPDKCYDGIRNFNQARPAVFDGGYAFMDIAPGKYVVEVIPPLGFSLLKEESNNVGFGDSYSVAPVAVPLPGGAAPILPDLAMIAEAKIVPGLAQPACVGTVRTVGDYLTLFPDELVEAPFARADRPLCDRKVVTLVDQGQAAADFFLFTEAPIAGHFVGMILDDSAQEFNPLSPSYGEKFAPPYVPVSVRDYEGNEISRLYSDQWGRINGLVPSTFTANMPSPSGFAPAMHQTCMNDPGPIPDPANPGQMIVDPQYNSAYSNFCYTFQYMPGTTTYLDTPVLPVSSFASGYNPPDCALDDTTPKIRQVDGTTRGVSGRGTTNTFGPLVALNGTLTIYSEGPKLAANPAYTGPTGTQPKSLIRNYDFGTAQGAAGSVTINGALLQIVSWTPGVIVATAPSVGVVGELQVTRANGNSTEHAVTVTVSNRRPNSVIRVGPTEAHQTIQAAIDAAPINRNNPPLIMVAPGNYDELIIMSKPVRIQGAGAGSTIINAVNRPTEIITSWRTRMDCLFGIGAGCTKVVDALLNQADGAAAYAADAGAAITVVAAAGGSRSFRANRRARIDGFSITGSDNGGGGILVNSNAHGLEISNNHIFGNSGSYSGGIRIGRPFLELVDDGPYAFNDRLSIHNNSIVQNGSLAGAGGGVSIATGSDRYNVSENYICGNFAKGDGGGIGHLGLSNNGQIVNNRVVLNQSFDQALTRSGGGVFIGGEPPNFGALTKGSGHVTVDGNLIQSNHAAAGHGGGIRTQFVNGRDIANDSRTGRWYRITMTNNMITNNVAGWSGGGISLSDTVRSRIFHNTVSNNDSTATVGPIINVNSSEAQPAGISSELHSALLADEIPVRNNTNNTRVYSNPTLTNNIVWHNRSFSYDATTGVSQLLPIVTQAAAGDCGADAQYWDLGVLGTNGAFQLDPRRSILTDTTGYRNSNISGDPAFIDSYCNGGREVAGPMFPLPALDEAGATWIDVRFGPLQIVGDYHITGASAGLDNANNTFVNHDFDNNNRPLGFGRDRGADEFAP